MPLEGERILLREERQSDLPFLVSLRNDMETQGWSKALPPDYTLEMYLKRFQARTFSYDPKEGRFIIAEKAGGELVGTIAYTGLQPRHAATIGIAMVKPFWGSGYAIEAQEVLLRFLYVELGLQVVRLWTHSGNVRMVGLAKKSGFRIAVRNRKTIYKDGHRYDNLVMDLLREEYFALHQDLTNELPGL